MKIKKLAILLAGIVITASPTTWAAFPVAGVDDALSWGKFKVTFTEEFATGTVNICADDTNCPTSAREFTSSMLSDPNTKIGRSAPHADGDGTDESNGAEICKEGDTTSCSGYFSWTAEPILDAHFQWKDGGYQADGQPFDEGPAGREEIHTQVVSINLSEVGSANAIKAGDEAPCQARSLGETESLNGSGFPAESMFQMYVEIDVDLNNDGTVDVVLFNKPGTGNTILGGDPLIFEATGLGEFPPKVVYSLTSDTSYAPKLYLRAPNCAVHPDFTDDNGDPIHVGWLRKTTHGMTDSNNSAQCTNETDTECFERIYTDLPDLPINPAEERPINGVLSVSITDSPDPLSLPATGSTLSYNVVVTLSADAPIPATGVSLEITLDNNVELQSVNSDSAMCDTSNFPILACSLTDLSVDNPGDISSVSVNIEVEVSDELFPLTFEAKVSANEYSEHMDIEITNQQLVINEIDYDQPSTDTAEFIEIKNFSTTAVSLNGYTVDLFDDATNTVYRTITLPDVSLAAGDYHVICGNPATVANCDQDHATDTDLIQNGSPDAIAIKKGSVFVDTVSYDGDTALATYTETTGTTAADSNTEALVGLSRYTDGTDTNDNSADFKLKCITPGGANNVDANDGCFELSINDPTAITEGDSGTKTIDFTVSLSHAATSDVTVNYATADNTAIAGSDYTAITATILTFAAGTNADKTVTVTISGDEIDEGTSEEFKVNLSNPSSNAQLSMISGATEGVGTITDNDDAGFTVTESSGTSVNESGTTDTFTVVLETKPTSDVVISVSSGDIGEATVDKASLTFTSSNWNTAQTVTVTGVDDISSDGNKTTTITLSIVDASSDDQYDPLDAQTVSVTTVDNDTPGITVNPSTLTVSEPSGTATFAITLNTKPSGTNDVSIASISTNNGQCSISSTSTTIANANWNTGTTFTVAAQNDNIVDGNQTCTIQIGTSTSGDNDYDSVNPTDVTVTVQDDDTAGIDGTSIGGSISITEGGTTGSYDIKLSSQPTNNVEITVTVDNTQTEISSDGTTFSNTVTLTFTNGDWNTAQTITVKAIDDSAIEDSYIGTISHAISGTVNDANYPLTLALGDVTVNITDNDSSSPAPTPTPSQPLPSTMTVTVKYSGNGFGKVTSEPSGINCHNDNAPCEQTFDTGESVTLTATANVGSEFVSFSGSSDCYKDKIFLVSDVTCTANFKLGPRTLSISGVENGTVSSSPQGILCGANSDQCSYEFNGGQTINLSATPNAGWMLESWEGDCEQDGSITLLNNAQCQPKWTLAPATVNDLSVEGVKDDGSIEFGESPVGTLITKTLTLTNTALVAMPLTDFALPDGFSLIGEFPEELATGEKVELQIQMDALLVGDYKGDLSFNVNGTPVTYALSGKVIEKAIDDSSETPTPSDPPTDDQTTTPVPSAPTTSSSGSSLISCHDVVTLQSNCNGNGNALTDLDEIEEGGQIANATIVTEVISQGWISNVTIGAEGMVSGGIATGTIFVSGYFESFEFRGASVSGLNEAGSIQGMLGGTIFNNSKVRGSIQDVLLAPNTSITGGILKKTIIGDSLEPALLEDLTVMSGSNLDNVIIGPNVEIAKNVTLGTGVEFVLPGVGINKDGKMISSQTGFLNRIRIKNQRHANGVKLTTVQVEELQIEEQLFVDTKHVGQSAEILIVAYHKTVTKTTSYMRVGKNWKVWNGEIARLEAATPYEALAERMTIPIFEGDLSGLPGDFTVYSGYRLETEQSIVFNGESPLKFAVKSKE